MWGPLGSSRIGRSPPSLYYWQKQFHHQMFPIGSWPFVLGFLIQSDQAVSAWQKSDQQGSNRKGLSRCYELYYGYALQPHFLPFPPFPAAKKDRQRHSTHILLMKTYETRNPDNVGLPSTRSFAIAIIWMQLKCSLVPLCSSSSWCLSKAVDVLGARETTWVTQLCFNLLICR